MESEGDQNYYVEVWSLHSIGGASEGEKFSANIANFFSIFSIASFVNYGQ